MRLPTPNEFVRCAVLRVIPWRRWPPLHVRRSIPLLFGDTKALLQVEVIVYPPDVCDDGPLIFRSKDMFDQRFAVGNTERFFEGIAESRTTDVRQWLTRAKPGDMDIVGGLVAQGPLERIDPFLELAVESTAASLTLTFAEALTPVGPIAFREKHTRQYVSPPFGIEVRKSSPLDSDSLEAGLETALHPFMHGTLSGDRRRVTSLVRASRRFGRAQTLLDKDDQFLDYWLVCEFLTSHVSVPRRGSQKPLRIAHALSRILNHDSQRIFDLLIWPLWLKRNEIVHGADTHPTFTRDDLLRLREVAEELMRAELQMEATARTRILEVLK